MIRTLVVDDEATVRGVLFLAFEGDERVEIVGEAADGDEAVRLWQELQPDAVVLDMQMPGLSGLDVARQMLASEQPPTVVMCSSRMEDADRDEAWRIGVAACLDKLGLERVPAMLVAAHARANPNRPV